MPRYLVRRDTFVSHECRLYKAGPDPITIDWPKGCEPKVMGDNLELVPAEKAAKPGKAGEAADLA